MEGKSFGKNNIFDFVVLDIICVQISFILAYSIRIGSFAEISNSYIFMNIMLLVVHLLVSFFTECYTGILSRGILVELKYVLVHNIFFAGIVLIIFYLLKISSLYSRIVIVLLFLFDTLFMWVARSVRKSMIMKKAAYLSRKTMMLVITSKADAEKVISNLSSYQYAAYRVIGVVLIDGEGNEKDILGVPVVETYADVVEYVKKNVVDEVFYSGDKNDDLIDALLKMGIKVHISMDRLFRNMPNATLENISEYTVVTSSINLMSFKQKVLKRLTDIIVSIFGIIATLLLYVIFAPVIFIQSPGPIFFKQDRVGKNGRIFKIYKFRTMYMDAEERKKELMAQNKMQGLMFKMDDDPRIIPIGRFLRRSSIDEFPQFWNVLKGEMSLVGTRPPTVDEYEKYDLHHKSRLAIKPGITGMWQVSGRSDITDFEEVVRLDNEYIENFNLRLDVKILWKTVLVVFDRKGSV